MQTTQVASAQPHQPNMLTSKNRFMVTLRGAERDSEQESCSNMSRPVVTIEVQYTCEAVLIK